MTSLPVHPDTAPAPAGITCQRAGRVAVVELDRPARGNAIDLAVARRLRDVLTELALEPSLGAVILVGAGRDFCVGGDLRDFAAAPDPRAFIMALATTAHEAVLAMRSLPVPIIASVQGACAGAGLGLALAADLVVAEETSRFLTAYTAVGLSPDCGVTWSLTRRLGPARAADLILTNRVMDADEANTAGLVSRLVPSGDARRAAVELADQLADGPAVALGHAVELVRAAPERALAAHLDHEARLIADAVASPEGAEGVAAFLAKRPPRFAAAREERRPPNTTDLIEEQP